MTTFFRVARRLGAALLLALPLAALAQTGVTIGATTAPDASAALDIISTTKGVLLPRVADATALATPATGLLVFQTGAPAGFYYNAGTPAAPSWQQLATASGAAVTASNGLTKTGQNIALGGTLTQATTIANGGFNLNVTGTGKVGIGTSSPDGQLANTSVNTFGSNGQGGGGGSLNWAANQSGYVAQFFNGGTTNAGSGVAVKIDGTDAGATALDVSKGTVANAPGTPLLVVKADGNVGIGNATPNASLDVARGTGVNGTAVLRGTTRLSHFNYSTAEDTYIRGGKATSNVLLNDNGGNVGIGTPTPSATLDVNGSTRLRGLATAGLVVTDANGNLSSSTSLPAGVSGDNLGNHTATQALNLQGNALTGTGASIGSAVGVGIRADGGLNIGQNTTGNNVYLGYQAGQATTTGFHNVFTGQGSGVATTTGFNNVFSGFSAGEANTTGSDNVFVGYVSGYQNTTGINNVFSGTQSGRNNTTGSINFFGGINSGLNNTTGNNNVFVGGFSGRYNLTGTNNTALGNNSGPANGSGALTNATALGAGVALTTSNTVVLGNGASVGIGTSSPAQKLDVAGTTQTTNAIVTTALTGTGANIGSTVGLGVRADGGLNIGQNTNGSIYLGYQAGLVNTGGSNLFSGFQSGAFNTTGSNNVFSGALSGFSNATGSSNTYTGYGSGNAKTAGNYNTFSGYASGQGPGGGTNNGSNNVFTGAFSGFATTTGSDNMFSGTNAGNNNSTGSNNVFSGSRAGGNNSTGSGNVFSGNEAGGNNTTGSNNTALGSGSGPATGSGALTNATALGANVALTTSNTVVLGNGANVGIGTPAPSATLDVNGSTRLRGLTTAGVVTTDASGNLGSSDATTAFGTSFIQNATTQQASSNFNIDGNGTVGGTLTAASAAVNGALTGNGADIGTVVGLGIRADGGLNIGQNTAGGNVYVGYQAGQANTTGAQNLFVGSGSGVANDTGSRNLFVGSRSGNATTSGNENVFVGVGSGERNSTGFNNTFTGTYAGYYSNTGNNNVFSGNSSGFSTSSGNNNVFSGSGSGFGTTSGSNNLFLGKSSGQFNDTGSNNTAVGYNSGPDSNHPNLTNATALGANVALTTSNTVILGNGANVGIGTSTPTTLLDLGSSAGALPTDAATRKLTLYNNAAGADFYGLGVSGFFLHLFANTAAAGPPKLSIASSGNVGIGSSYTTANAPSQRLDVDGNARLRGLTTAGLVVTDANGNLSSSTSLPAGVSGDNLGNHTATQALNLQGNALTGTGASIGSAVGVGIRADGGLNIGQNANGNVFLGYQAGRVTTGGNNVFSGYSAGVVNTTGLNNVFSGTQSGFSNTTGSQNTFSGFNSGQYNITGSNNTALGNNSGPASGSGAISNATALGAGVALTTSNTVVLGNGANVGIGTSAPATTLDVRTADGSARLTVGTTANTGGGIALGNPAHGLQRGYPTLNADNDVGLYTTAGDLYLSANGTSTGQFVLLNNGNVGIGMNPAYKLDVNGQVRATNVAITSDRRFKTNIRPIGSALAGVLALRGVRYEWNKLGVQHGGTAGAGQVGLIAQELEAVYPELVATDAQGFKSVNYAQLAPVLIEALKEQQAQLEALKAQNAALGARVATAETDNQAMKAQATATADAFEARLRRLEAAGEGQAQK